ncbi:MAG TPA: glutaminyl-peptide cyclotransferase, partial [Gammaproteobacteria bacterium]|nr:glutaminyl-peptide cyclotransferase [Gammaproteobacteria bacterium]
ALVLRSYAAMPAVDDKHRATSARPGSPASRSRAVVWVAAAVVALVVVGVAAWAQLAHRGPALYGFKVVAAYPHDPGAYTQGLVIEGGRLYEGTGRYGASSIRRVDLDTGRVEKIHAIGDEYFGEGIAILGNRLYELTWKNGLAFVYDLDSFNVLQTLRYSTEGWGLTHDGQHLILSDGSATLRFLDPATFKTIREITVRDGDQPVAKLNELEYVDGEIWSNVWYDDRIARISPADGRVLGWIDLADIYPKAARGSDDVLNGIAYDPAKRRLFVTGKNWPQLFEIDVVRK